MENFAKKAAYLKGFAEGLDMSPKSDEGRLLAKIVEVIEEMADELDTIGAYSDELTERVNLIDEDLGDIEEDYYKNICGMQRDSFDDEDFDFRNMHDADDEDMDDDMDYFEIECPNCKDDVLIDYDMLEDGKEIICPNCKQEIELEFDCDCDDCDCGCDDDDCDCDD